MERDDEPAERSLTVSLQVGRGLPPVLLGLAVAVRNLVLILISMGVVDYVAPAWVLVRDTATGTILLRLSAGREPGVGEHLLQVLSADLPRLSRSDFLATWSGS